MCQHREEKEETHRLVGDVEEWLGGGEGLPEGQDEERFSRGVILFWRS